MDHERHYEPGTIYTARAHPDGIRLSWDDGDIDMPGRTDTDLWTVIGDYCEKEQDPELWDALDEDNILSDPEGPRDWLLFDEPRTWHLDACDVIYDYGDAGGEMTIIIHGPEGDRAMVIPAGYGQVAAMDEGDDPTRGWEDGNGRAICYDSALPWDGEQVLPWAVETIDTGTGESAREYRAEHMDAVIAAQSAWDALDPVDRIHTEVRWGQVGACSEPLTRYESIAVIRRSPGSIPRREVEEYLAPFFANDRPGDLIAEAGGDADRAARDWVDWYYGEDSGLGPGIAADNRAELAETLGITPDELIPLVSEYMAEASARDGQTITCAKTVAANGNGLMISITKEARILGLGRGDAVEITIRRFRAPSGGL